MLRWVYLFNLGLGIFNLIPLPPLDGGHFLPYIFPRASWAFVHQLEQYGPFILILLVMTGATRYIMGPALAIINGFYSRSCGSSSSTGRVARYKPPFAGASPRGAAEAGAGPTSFVCGAGTACR